MFPLKADSPIDRLSPWMSFIAGSPLKGMSKNRWDYPFGPIRIRVDILCPRRILGLVDVMHGVRVGFGLQDFMFTISYISIFFSGERREGQGVVGRGGMILVRHLLMFWTHCSCAGAAARGRIKCSFG